MTGAGARLRGPADQRTIRDHNLALVLQHVAREGESSRARLASVTGLNKTTVSSLVGELIDRRLVRETGRTYSGEAGRPAVNLQLDGEVFVAVGMEVNVHYMGYSVTDLRGRVRDERFLVGDNRARPAHETLTELAELVGEALRRLRADGLVPVGANLALPGLVDAVGRDLLVAPNLGWADVPAAALLEPQLPGLGGDLLVNNEANLAALAERWEGAAHDLADFVHVSGEVGVGAGIVIDGALHRGATGFGGEFGHMTLVPDGPDCACGGRGCVETFVGLEPMLALAGVDLGDALDVARTATGPAADLARAAAADDDTVLAALASVGARLGTALASAVNLLGPEAIVLGGYFAPLHPWLAPAIEDELHRRVLAERHRPTAIVQSQLQQGAAVRGAATMVLRAVLADPARLSAQTRSM